VNDKTLSIKNYFSVGSLNVFSSGAVKLFCATGHYRTYKLQESLCEATELIPIRTEIMRLMKILFCALLHKTFADTILAHISQKALQRIKSLYRKSLLNDPSFL
jgi:hypothetical protein